MSEVKNSKTSSFDIVTPKEVLSLAYSAFNQPVFESIISVEDHSSFDDLRKYLAEKIAIMMDKNFDLLVSSLYRIDINEEKVMTLFAGDNRESIPEGLADLVIERQLQKIHYRNLYKKQSTLLRLD